MLEKLRRFEEIERKYDLVDEVANLKKEYAISNFKELKKALDEINQKERNLKIGIVGRVKSGKSSLLNSLIFDGRSVLPKAATPMTAALSVLEFGDKFEANIELYNNEDIENLKEKVKKFESLVEQKAKNIYEDLVERKKRKNKPFNESELKNEAFERAKKEVPEDLRSAYEQFEMMKKNRVKKDEIPQRIEANNFEELNEKLKDYVGSNGKYMPFTKAVKITVNDALLKGLSIIDTPGINDPVVSREERTRELLKYCDVILILSPSGQFMSQEDLDLIGRIKSKEGIREIYLITSQIDMQLFGSEKRDNLYEAIEDIVKKHTNIAIETFEKDVFLKESPVFEFLKKNGVFSSSAISYSIYKKFDTKNFDENEEHVLRNLKFHYPAYFEQNAKENLLKLSGIPKIKSLIEGVKEQKEKIINEKVQNFEKEKLKNFEEFKQELIEKFNKKIAKLNSSDIEEIKAKKEKLEKIKTKATVVGNETFRDLVDELEINLKNALLTELNKFFSEANREIRDSESTETVTKTETVTVDEEGIWGGIKRFLGGLFGQDDWGKKEEIKTYTETYTVVRAGIVRNALEELTDNVENIISLRAKEYINSWRKNIFKDLIGVLRDVAGDENLEISVLSAAIRKVINSVELPDISYSNTLPSSLRKSGTLQGYEAEVFIDDARDYVSNLKSMVKNDINNYVNSLVSKLQNENIAGEIFKSYDEEIAKLEEEIKTKEVSLARYKRILQELKEL